MYQAKKNDAGKESDAGQLTEKAHEAKEEARPPIKAPVEKQTNETSDILNLNEEVVFSFLWCWQFHLFRRVSIICDSYVNESL